jgi:hypothetical protein
MITHIEVVAAHEVRCGSAPPPEAAALSAGLSPAEGVRATSQPAGESSTEMTGEWTQTPPLPQTTTPARRINEMRLGSKWCGNVFNGQIVSGKLL